MEVGLLGYYPCVYYYTGGHHGSGTIGLLPLCVLLHRWTSWEWDYWAITLMCAITQVDILGVGLLS